MKLHREGMSWILVSFAILALGIILAATVFNHWLVQTLITAVPAFFFLVILQFFRSPARHIQATDKDIIAPCDGKVVVIEKVMEKEYLNTEMIQVSIFMSPVNVHINWFPCNGVVSYTKYHPGKYLVAWNPKSSELNERSSVGIRMNHGRMILVRQVAGILARKIVTYAKTGRPSLLNKEMGFIKFGSRVDLYLPLDSELAVKIGQKVTGNQTRIALVK